MQSSSPLKFGGLDGERPGFLPQTGQKSRPLSCVPVWSGRGDWPVSKMAAERTRKLSGELVCKKGQLNGELCKERCDYMVNSCKLVFACLLVDFG